MEDTSNHPNYILVWVALAVLTAVEVGITFLSWSKTMLIVVLIGLAVWKAVLVAMYFMHLKYEKRPLRILAVAPIPLAFILVLVVITEFRW